MGIEQHRSEGSYVNLIAGAFNVQGTVVCVMPEKSNEQAIAIASTLASLQLMSSQGGSEARVHVTFSVEFA